MGGGASQGWALRVPGSPWVGQTGQCHPWGSGFHEGCMNKRVMKSASMFTQHCRGQVSSRAVLVWSPQEATAWNCEKWSLDCVWSPKMLEVPEPWDIYQEELHGGASPRDRSVSDATKLEEQSHVGPLTSDMEPQDLEYGMLTFCLALVKHFLTIPLFIPSKSVMYILGYSMLKYVMCFMILQGLRLRDCLESQ